jgi:cytochrome c oxidase subunit II
MSMLRLRQAAPALLIAAVLLVLTACGETEYPNSTFNRHTDLNTSIDTLWDRLLFWGTIVFVVVESALIFTIIRFRKRPGGPAAKQIHGNAALEITWTAIPAVILVLIAVPTVKTIFETQAAAPAGALRIEVIGHQWWWEFRYPESASPRRTRSTCRWAARSLRAQDEGRAALVLDPADGGKRDLITNKTNYMWFTPDADSALGVERLLRRVLRHEPREHEVPRLHGAAGRVRRWAAHQATPAVFPAPRCRRPRRSRRRATRHRRPRRRAGYVFPRRAAGARDAADADAGRLAFDDALLARRPDARDAGVPARRLHRLPRDQRQPDGGVATSGRTSRTWPARHTIAGGLFPNDGPHLARWIKNAPP